MVVAVSRGDKEGGVDKTSLKPPSGASILLITFVPHLSQNLEPDASETPHSEHKRLIRGKKNGISGWFAIISTKS